MNKYSQDEISSKITFGICLLSITGICVCIAWQNLSALGAIRIFSLASLFLLAAVFIQPNFGKSVVVLADVFTLAFFLFPKTIDLFSRYIGAGNEQIFLLKTPKSVSLLVAAVWSFFWLAVYYIGISIEDKAIYTALMLSVFVIAALAFFSNLTINIIKRRIVVVPNGIVICDPITLSDTILLPLSKLKNIHTLSLSDFATSHSEQKSNEYFGNIGIGKVTQLTLLEKTDSFIIRKNHLNTERKDIDELYISLVSADAFESLFRDRFHGPEKDSSTQLRSAQDDKSDKIEILKMEKELGIETAPKSDAKLPEWRKKS